MGEQSSTCALQQSRETITTELSINLHIKDISGSLLFNEWKWTSSYCD